MAEGVSVFLVVLTICVTICILRALSNRNRRDSRYDTDDTRIMQEINRGMQRMEDRVEALETLLMDRSKHTRPYRDVPRGEF